MKKYRYLSILILITALTAGCDTLLDVEEKPEAKEKNGVAEITFVDRTGIMHEITGSDKASGVEVILRSAELGLEYSATSNEEGVVRFEDLISDKYLISFRRPLTAQERETADLKHFMYKLSGTSPGRIEVRADEKFTETIIFDTLVTETPLVISEIYACGPPEAGLYFHDKYVEIYNQSDEVIYLDSLLLAYVYSSEYYGHNYIDDPNSIHTKNLWMFPGDGNDYPIAPGEFVVCAEDAIDHRINAPYSVDLSGVTFEFYKDDAPDIDNGQVPNMIRIYQPAGNDWLIGGEEGALVIASYDPALLTWYDDQMMFPYSAVLDGVEYLSDVTKLEEKILNLSIDAGAAGGIEFYTGKTMERKVVEVNGKRMLKDDNNSSLDFTVYEHPSPEYHNGF